MPALQRYAVLTVFGVLWLSGCVWLVLDQFFVRTGPFGAMPHPWQPGILLAHGIVAIIGTYLLGWVSARHALRFWRHSRRRVSGGSLAVVLILLTVSGFALFFTIDDRWQHGTALLHDALGLGFTLFAIHHWFFSSRRVMRRAASRPW